MRTARNWLLAAAATEEWAIAKHFIAVTSNQSKAMEFGIQNKTSCKFGIGSVVVILCGLRWIVSGLGDRHARI